MNLQNLTREQVQDYIHQEHLKGRPMREVVREAVAGRDDFTLLSPDPEIANQQMLNALGVKVNRARQQS